MYLHVQCFPLLTRLSRANCKGPAVQRFKGFKQLFVSVMHMITTTSTGGCQVEKLPAISRSLGEKRELNEKCKITNVQEGKVKIFVIVR